MPLLISTVAMFQAQNRETLNSTLKVAVSFKIIIDDEHDKIVFQKTAKELQDKGQFFWPQISLVLRPTVSDTITATE